MVGRHRRVTIRDVVAYQSRGQSERRAALAELAKDSIAHYDKLPKATPPGSAHSERVNTFKNSSLTKSNSLPTFTSLRSPTSTSAWSHGDAVWRDTSQRSATVLMRQ